MIGKLWPDSNCSCWGALCLNHAIWMRWSFTRPRASQKASAGFRSTPSQVLCYIILYYIISYMCIINTPSCWVIAPGVSHRSWGGQANHHPCPASAGRLDRAQAATTWTWRWRWRFPRKTIGKLWEKYGKMIEKHRNKRKNSDLATKMGDL